MEGAGVRRRDEAGVGFDVWTAEEFWAEEDSVTAAVVQF